MPESVTADIKLLMTVREKAAQADLPAASERIINHQAFNKEQQYSATSTPAAAKVLVDKPLAASTSYDLTNFTDAFGNALDATGEKVRALLIANPEGNDGNVTIKPNGTNGYDLFGASKDLVLEPGASALFNFDQTLAAVSGTEKVIDVENAGTAAAAEFILITG